jgi:hypothetical protein
MQLRVYSWDMTTSGYRTVNRFVQYDIELTGEPVIWVSRHEAVPRVSVQSVRLRFGHGDDGFFMEANVQGPYLSRTGKPLKARADDYAGAPDLWPAWLAALAEEHRPSEYVTHLGPLSSPVRATEVHR